MGNNNQKQHIYRDFFNIIQLALDIRWLIAGDEAHNTDALLVKMFAEHSKTVEVDLTELSFSTPVCISKLTHV